jgi:hypothetical protein
MTDGRAVLADWNAGKTLRCASALQPLCAYATELEITVNDLLAALKCFVADGRFDVAVGGNPNAVAEMLKAANDAIARAESAPTGRGKKED